MQASVNVLTTFFTLQMQDAVLQNETFIERKRFVNPDQSIRSCDKILPESYRDFLEYIDRFYIETLEMTKRI